MLDIYNFVVNMLGQLPIELTWLYSACTFILFLIICLCVISPLIICYLIVRR